MSSSGRHSFRVLTLAGALASVAASSSAADLAGRIDIGDGRQMYLECRGEGSPVVVLISGKGDRADIWSTANPDKPGATVFEEVSKLTRVCAYDRPGTVGVAASEPSRSDPVPVPTTAAAGAADLWALLRAAEVPGPYVLVGHSMGGLIARLVACDHGDEISGLVLVDALSEELYGGLTDDQQAILEKINTGVEDYDMPASFAQIREAPPVALMPVVVLTAGRPQLTPEAIESGQFPPEITAPFVDALWAAQMTAQDRLAGLFPGGRHVVVPDSTHYIHIDQPEVVVDAIRDVLEAAVAEDAVSLDAVLAKLAPPPSGEALARIPDPGRKLLALRSYLRSGAKIADRWSWTEAQIKAFEGSPEEQALLEEIEAVKQHFGAANPGYEIYVHGTVRSLDDQLASWNKNDSVGTGAEEILAAYDEAFGEDGLEPVEIDVERLAAWLRDFAPSKRANLAAPGLTLHGRAGAIDFQVMKDGSIYAGANSAQVESIWRGEGWDEKLKASIDVAGPSFSGPLKNPDEPWHYDYASTPAAAAAND